MTPLTKLEKEKLLSRMFWDINVITADIDELINEKLKTIDQIESQQFLSRLLVSCDWYTLIKLVPQDKLQKMLSDQILDRLFPADLKDRYVYARTILSRKTISVSG